MDSVTPNELARTLGISGLQFRNWLRAKKAAGHPMLAGHVKHQHYHFSPAEARGLLGEYRAEHGRGRSVAPTRARPRAAPAATADDAPLPPSKDPGHRVKLKWRGATVTTLEDLLRPGLLGVVVGINPAPVSVAAGHYWQGRAGQRLWERLRSVGLLPDDFDGFEDDAAFEAGVGFTDVVKRPTPRASEVDASELAHGRADVERKLEEARAPLVIFAFKGAAEALLGPFAGNGFIPERRLGSAAVFVMPGPYEKRETAAKTLNTLRRWVRRQRG